MPDHNDTPRDESRNTTPSTPGAAKSSEPETEAHPLWHNVITIGGMYIAIMALILLLTFGLFSVVSPASNPYVDIFGYLAIPVLMGIGVALMPLGILFKSWRIRRIDPTQKLSLRFPRINLNDPRQRRVAKLTVLGILLFLPILGVSSYHGYHYTDSTQFCANACHSVMEPQAVAFSRSSHARVACAECHIGSGASWFVKSKLSGTRQVFAVVFDTYHRPIPPAIEQLRPARETCEQCHWPNKFFGAQLRQIARFKSDENNTRRDIEMLVKTGGADLATGRAEGIHKHMLFSGKIEYIATDDKLQEIPWVRWIDESGEELIYRSDGEAAASTPPDGQRRMMDCMDCHNRPAHKFHSPSDGVNAFLETGGIDPGIPYIKREAVKALAVTYPNDDAAHEGIVKSISDFYRKEYPKQFEEDGEKIRAAAEATSQIYDQNFFPYMRVDWRTYPDNIGHLESPGCFRCHDGKHVNQHGNAISHECSSCHTFLNTVHVESKKDLISKGEFQHPYELDATHAAVRCDQCHTGGLTPETTCAGCHTGVQGLFAGSDPVFARFKIEPDPMADDVGCSDCHDLSQPLTRAKMNTVCADCHDDEYDGKLDEWDAKFHDVQAKFLENCDKFEAVLDKTRTSGADAARQTLEDTRNVLIRLNHANHLHNPDAAIKVLDALTDEVNDAADKMSVNLGKELAGSDGPK
ncbi:MAG: NapC/NirT family cytochrome c [Phycisphaerales bacterium]|nr:NapC/NirT family cytochrome c [Phycisphaerales bacterium]